jgi:hypothetical protein
LYFADHSGGRGAARGSHRGVVHEERLVGHQRLLLADPLDRLVGHVLGEVVALLRRFVGLDRAVSARRARVVLVRLAADEAVEVLEAAAGVGQRSNGPIGLVSQTGTSWHLPNWRSE